MLRKGEKAWGMGVLRHFQMILLSEISRGHCELFGQLAPPAPPPPTTVLQVDQPAAWPAVCCCRRFKQRGLISISVCVNTLITHLSNEAAVSQPFSCMGIMVRVSVRVCACVLASACVCEGGGLWETRVAYDKSVGMLWAVQRKKDEIGKWPHTGL